MQDLERDNISNSLEKTQKEVCRKTGLSSRGLNASTSNFDFLIHINFSCCFFPCGARDRTQSLTHVRRVLNLRINDAMFRDIVNTFLDVEGNCFHDHLSTLL